MLSSAEAMAAAAAATVAAGLAIRVWQSFLICAMWRKFVNHEGILLSLNILIINITKRERKEKMYILFWFELEYICTFMCDSTTTPLCVVSPRNASCLCLSDVDHVALPAPQPSLNILPVLRIHTPASMALLLLLLFVIALSFRSFRAVHFGFVFLKFSTL